VPGSRTYTQSDDQVVRYSDASDAAAAADAVSSTAGRHSTDGVAVTRGVDRFLIAVRLGALHPSWSAAGPAALQMIDLAVVRVFFRSTPHWSAEKKLSAKRVSGSLVRRRRFSVVDWSVLLRCVEQWEWDNSVITRLLLPSGQASFPFAATVTSWRLTNAVRCRVWHWNMVIPRAKCSTVR